MKQMLAAAILTGVCTVVTDVVSAQLPPLSPPHLNPAIEKLAAGGPVYGVLTQDVSRENARVLGRRDTDFVFVDMEHSPFNMDARWTPENARQTILQACLTHNVACYVSPSDREDQDRRLGEGGR